MRSLVRHELKHNLRPVVVLPLLGLFLILIYDRVHDPWSADFAQVQGALAQHGECLLPAVPLLAGVVGSSLSDEQRRGVALTTLSKGITRSRYVLAKALGAAASGAVLTMIAIASFYVVVAILWPWGRVRLSSSHGPVPALFDRSPLANDLLGACMLVAAGAAWPTLAVLASTMTSNRYIAMVTPLLLLLASIVLREGVDAPFLRSVLPSLHLEVWISYPRIVPPAFQPFAAFVYWACFGLVLTVIAQRIYARRELA